MRYPRRHGRRAPRLRPARAGRLPHRLDPDRASWWPGSTGGIDPRAVGSGRTGGTNALRAMGPTRGVTVGLFDGCKGAIPVLIAMYFEAPGRRPGAGRRGGRGRGLALGLPGLPRRSRRRHRHRGHVRHRAAGRPARGASLPHRHRAQSLRLAGLIARLGRGGPDHARARDGRHHPPCAARLRQSPVPPSSGSPTPTTSTA